MTYRKFTPSEVLTKKIIEHKTTRVLAAELGCSHQTVHNRTKGRVNPHNLASVLCSDYLGKRSKLSAQDKAQVEKWVTDNILLLTEPGDDSYHSVRQSNYLSRTQCRETIEYIVDSVARRDYEPE